MYDYGNTRLRAVRSRLLSRDQVEGLTGAADLEEMTRLLLKTRYRRPLERALASKTGARAVDRAMRTSVRAVAGRMRDYYDGRAGRCIRILLEQYDLENARTLLRGLDRGLSAAEIAGALAVIGSVDEPLLREIADADGLRAGIDRMAAAGLAIAAPLIAYRAEHPGGGLFEFEIALNRWYFGSALAKLASPGPSETPLRDWLHTKADHVNLSTVLRIAHEPGIRERLAARRGLAVEDLLLEAGSLDGSRLMEAAQMDTVDSALRPLQRTAYRAALETGRDAYRLSGRLSAFERALSVDHLQRMARDIPMHPLGMAVPIGVLALQQNQAANIRSIAWGLRVGLRAAEIAEDLEFPA